MLISSLRALRSAQQSAPIAAAASLSHVWRCLATASDTGGGTGGTGGSSDATGGSSRDATGTEPAPAASAIASGVATAGEQFIAIDRSGLITPPPHSHDPAEMAAAAAHKEPETELVRHLKALIQVNEISIPLFKAAVLVCVADRCPGA